MVWKNHKELDKNIAYQGVLDITISHDGTWQKHWNTKSMYGIGLVIDILTGLVIDYEILSKYYPECVSSKRHLGEHNEDTSK